MTSVYFFWIWTVAISFGVWVASRTRWKGLLFFLYRPLVLLGYSVATLSAVRLYLQQVLAGNTGTAMSLYFHQGYINPVVNILLSLDGNPLIRLIELPADFFVNPTTGCPTGPVAFILWWVMFTDLFLGNLFWLVVSSTWICLVKRKIKGPQEDEQHQSTQT